MKQRILAIAQGVLIALVVLSGAIAMPILFRPFFYWHIAPLGLPELVELTVPEIKTAYNEVMNYCIGLSDTFSAGSLPFSDAGAEHFADVQKLFALDLRALVVSAILLIGIRIVFQKEKLRLLDHTPGFGVLWDWGSVFRQWVLWRRWISIRHLPYSINCSSPVRIIGYLIHGQTRLFSCCLQNFSETAPS